MEPMPPAAAVTSGVPVCSSAPERRPSRSKRPSHAVSEVSGSAAACAKGEGGRLGADEALVDGVEAGVGAGPGERPGVVDLVADPEELHHVADGDHCVGRVPAEHRRLAARVDVLADARAG